MKVAKTLTNLVASPDFQLPWNSYASGTSVGTRTQTDEKLTIRLQSITGGSRRYGVNLTGYNFGSHPAGSHITMRAKVDTIGMTSDTKLCIYFDFRATTGGHVTVILEALVGDTEVVIEAISDREIYGVQPYIWIEPSPNVVWSGDSKVVVTEVECYITSNGAVPATYRDGNSPNWSWAGASGNSISSGPAMVEAPIKVLKGGVWQPATVKRWTGSEWVDA